MPLRLTPAELRRLRRAETDGEPARGRKPQSGPKTPRRASQARTGASNDYGDERWFALRQPFIDAGWLFCQSGPALTETAIHRDGRRVTGATRRGLLEALHAEP